MSEMVDRAAIAMVEFLITKDPTTPPWDEADEGMRDAMREAVRPQVAAMRNPPDEILLAIGEPYGGGIDRAIGLQVRRDAWNKMIDAILAGGAAGA